MKTACLGCYGQLDHDDDQYHMSCSRKLFGTTKAPVIEFDSEQLEELALTSVSQHFGITGVQKKISVNLEKHRNDSGYRVKIVTLEPLIFERPFGSQGKGLDFDCNTNDVFYFWVGHYGTDQEFFAAAMNSRSKVWHSGDFETS